MSLNRNYFSFNLLPNVDKLLKNEYNQFFIPGFDHYIKTNSYSIKNIHNIVQLVVNDHCSSRMLLQLLQHTKGVHKVEKNLHTLQS